jgi:hypothetical protein
MEGISDSGFGIRDLEDNMIARLCRATLLACAVATALPLTAVRTADLELVAPGDPPGATCYHFPLITVCCDAGGCYITR